MALTYLIFLRILIALMEVDMDISQAKCPGCQYPMQVTQMRCPDCDLTLSGEFELGSLARLSLEDQLFVIAFLRHHGSIKKMESLFDISYPTVKNRLNAIAGELDSGFTAPEDNSEILEKLARGEISVADAMEALE